jgi:DNA-binding CsgD family transcriptional regulator
MRMDLLAMIAEKLPGGSKLSPVERAELLRIALGFAPSTSAAALKVPLTTIEARRKRIYRELGAAGATQVISSLLAFSLRMLAEGASVARAPRDVTSSGVTQGDAVSKGMTH